MIVTPSKFKLTKDQAEKITLTLKISWKFEAKNGKSFV